MEVFWIFLIFYGACVLTIIGWAIYMESGYKKRKDAAEQAACMKRYEEMKMVNVYDLLKTGEVKEMKLTKSIYHETSEFPNS